MTKQSSNLPDPYGRTTHDGRPIDNATAARLRQAEEILGYPLTITQGIGGATASAGTHTEGRAVDLAPWDQVNKVRVLRDLGFAAWFRPAVSGLWPAHIHAVLIFDGRGNERGIAASAWRQIGSYDRGRDGLKNDLPDPNPYRPSPARGFSMEDYRKSFEKPTPKRRFHELEVVCFNMWVGNKDPRRNLRQLIEDTSRPPVLSLQEVGYGGTPQGYHRIQSDGRHKDSRSSVLMIRNRGVKVLNSGVLDMADFGSPGWTWGPKGQPKTKVKHPPKQYPWARIETDGQQWSVLGGHRVAGGFNLNQEEWVAEHAAIVRWFERRSKLPCIASMDWNDRVNDHERLGVEDLIRRLQAQDEIIGIDGSVVVGADRSRSRKLDEMYGADAHRPVVTTVKKEI